MLPIASLTKLICQIDFLKCDSECFGKIQIYDINCIICCQKRRGFCFKPQQAFLVGFTLYKLVFFIALSFISLLTPVILAPIILLMIEDIFQMELPESLYILFSD